MERHKYYGIQAILFDKKKFTKKKAEKWIKNNKYHPLKLHITKNKYRFRLIEPNKGTTYRIKKLADSGIEFVMGYQ